MVCRTAPNDDERGRWRGERPRPTWPDRVIRLDSDCDLLGHSASRNWWAGQMGRIFGAVKPRRIRPLVYVMVALQLLLSVPMAPAWAAGVTAETDVARSMPCDGTMPAEQQSKHCPCCPDGAVDLLECHAACAASVAVFLVNHLVLANTAAIPSAEPQPVNFLPLADPPLKPPPIA